MDYREERRRARRAEWDRLQEQRERERLQREALPLWDQIEALSCSDDLKRVLHKIAQGERED
jgi:hypothetical protein